MTISPDEFRRALARFASGVTVVTSRDAGGGLHGITVSAFCSVSLEPPLILVCIEKNTGSHLSLSETDYFAVNVLGAEQQHLSQRFASYIPNKFETVEFSENERGVPVLKDVLANLECRRADAHDGGDHTIFVGQIEKITTNDGNPLVYFLGNYRKIDE